MPSIGRKVGVHTELSGVIVLTVGSHELVMGKGEANSAWILLGETLKVSMSEELARENSEISKKIDGVIRLIEGHPDTNDQGLLEALELLKSL